MSTFIEYAVERATTEKLEPLLNSIAEKGRAVQQVQFIGGRDWVIVSAREVPLGYERWEVGSTAYERSTPSTRDGVAGQNIDLLDLKVGLYEEESRVTSPDGVSKPLNHAYKGWIEDASESWIIFLDGLGRPCVYWPNRDSNGGVVGDPIQLTVGSTAEPATN